MPSRDRWRRVSLTPLATALLLASGLAVPPSTNAHVATVLAVLTCEDDGPGSLRATVAAATSGDTVDLSALTCTRITLSTGAILVAQDGLTLIGAAIGTPTIDGAGLDRVLQHTGAGTLHLRALGLAAGSADADGGCVASMGSLDLDRVDVGGCVVRNATEPSLLHGGGLSANGDATLQDSRVHDCSVYSIPGSALGGGVFAHATMTLTRSTVSGNTAITLAPTGTLLPGGTVYASALGGGVESDGTLTLVDSTLSSNQALAPNNAGTSEANGGGAHVAHGSLFVSGSTLDHNRADHNGGGAMVIAIGNAVTTIADSTLSGNHAGRDAGGLFTQPWLTLTNSTVAFNESVGSRGGGLLTGFDQTATLKSTILAGNQAAGSASDVTLGSKAHLSGSHNLIGVGGDTLVDTIVADPRLGPLRDNGGPARTQALLSGSPAIDAGSSTAATPWDQRGDPHPRVIGTVADIGALEFDPAETVFADGFD